jgi:ferredoxin
VANVKILPQEKSIEIPNGKTIQEATDGMDVGILYGCRSGRCGSCIVRVVENMDNLSHPEKREKIVLKNLMATPDERLACQARVLGDVTLEGAG